MSDLRLSNQPELQQFLRRALFGLRWGTLVILFPLAAMQSAIARLGTPMWVLVAVFAGYNLLADLVWRRLRRPPSFLWIATLDLLIAGVLYFFSAEPGGPLYILFVLAVDSAAANLPLRGTLLYAIAGALVVAVVDLSFPFWYVSDMDIRLVSVRAIVLVLVGIGMAILTRRLVLEQEATRIMHHEAERLKEIDQARTDFVATISHELWTPFTAARAGLGLVETSATDRLRTDEQELLANAQRNLERLGILIRDLLVVGRLENGAVSLDSQVLDLHDILTDALTSVGPLIQQRGQRLQINVPGPLLTEGDRRLLEQVVMNLLANANRHTPPGTRIMVTGRIADSEVCLSVSDTGPGISAEEQGLIFRRFHRSHSGGGMGLGLAIARALVELHEGRLWVESEPGKGAAFHIALPRAHNEGVHDIEAANRR